jgi:hypothetical protein
MNVMASERQREANRRNGRLGGPKSDAGKQRSCSNSLKHGLTSSTLVVLPEEHQHEYDEVLRGFSESLQPADSIEDALVLRLAQAHWRSLRARRIETGMLNTTAATHRNMARKLVDNCPEHLNVHNAIGAGFLIMPPEQWQTYLRYDTTISREFFKTLDALTKLQRVRQLKKPAPPPALALTAAAGPTASTELKADSCQLTASSTAPSQLSASGIRSVSQNRPLSPNLDEQRELSHDSKEQNLEQCATKVVVTSGTIISAFSPTGVPFETV